MPIELREGEQRVKEDKTKQEDVEEGEEVTRPPFSALSHMKIEDIEFVINLCPGRHDRIEAPPQKGMNEKNADGKATEGKKTCKNPACRLRQELLNGMIKANEEMAAEIQEMAASLDELKVEADDAEEELEAQKRTLADAEKRTEILDAEEKRLSEQSEFCRSVETIAKNRMTTMEAERQTLARILFESKLKKQGIELTGFEGDGMTLQPSRGFAGAPPDFSEEPKDDHVEGIPGWCSMEPLNLNEHMKVQRRSQLGVPARSTMVRPRTSPASFRAKTDSRTRWEAQAYLLPQPSIASSVGSRDKIRRLPPRLRAACVPKPRSPSFDARATIRRTRAENSLARTLRDGGNSVDSWKSDPATAPGSRAPPPTFAETRRLRSPSRRQHPDSTTALQFARTF